MIGDPLLRWAVTLLFTLTAVQSGYAIASLRPSWQAIVGHLLHLIMAVAMIVMAWPYSMHWPTLGPMIFFIVAAGWYLVSIAVPEPEARRHHCGCGAICICDQGGTCVPTTATSYGRRIAVYHAAMMGAMAWMYAAMNTSLLPGRASPASHDAHMQMHMDMQMGAGMDMHPGMQMDTDTPTYVTTVNALLMTGFAVAALCWLYRYLVRRRAAGNPAQVLTFAGDLAQIFMATGMAIMFGTMV
ncbi:MAG: DUF5134 domain-containing protein [Gordonia sp. (in: high G+C Gram-positive bacteria)]